MLFPVRAAAGENRLGDELRAQLERLAGALEGEGAVGLWAGGVKGAGGGDGEDGSSRGPLRWSWDYTHKGPRPVAEGDGLQLLPEAPPPGESGPSEAGGEGEEGGGAPGMPSSEACGKRGREDEPTELAAGVEAEEGVPEKRAKKKNKKEKKKRKEKKKEKSRNKDK